MTIRIKNNMAPVGGLPGPNDLVLDQAYLCLKYGYPCVLSPCEGLIVYLNDGDILDIDHAPSDMCFKPINVTIEISEA